MARKNDDPQVIDVITTVRQLDTCQKGSSEHEKAHKLAVKAVEIYNNFYKHPEFSMSIRKARHLIQSMDFAEKQKIRGGLTVKSKRKAGK